MTRQLLPFEIEACAHAAHEANRAYSLTLGDESHKPWHKAPEWQKETARAAVLAVAANDKLTAEQSHEAWVNHKLLNGWQRSETKDTKKKTHPCLVPWKELPRAQQSKDTMFLAVIRSMLAAIWSGEQQ